MFNKLAKKAVSAGRSVKVALTAAGASIGAASANAAVTMPTPSYTDIEAAAVVGFGIVITVALLVKAKSFLRG